MAKKKYDTITVKKYANRRLYDTSKSQYITLQDISEMVREDLDFIVVDAKTGEDLTHSVLAQIVLDQESANPTMFQTDFMRKIIGLYGNGMEQFVPNMLSGAMDNLMNNQEKLQEQLSSSYSQMEEIGRRNMAIMENAMSAFNPFMAASSSTTAPASDKDARIAELEAQIQALQDQINKRSA